MGKIFEDEELIKLIHEEGCSQKVAAQRLGVSEAAVSKRLKRLSVAVNNNTALFNAPSLLDRKLSQMQRLIALTTQTEELMQLVEIALNSQGQEYNDARMKLYRLTGAKGNLGTFLLQLRDQLRKELDLFRQIEEKTYNIQQVKEFQEVVLDEIRRIDPEVARRITRRLVEINAAYTSLDFGLDRE